MLVSYDKDSDKIKWFENFKKETPEIPQNVIDNITAFGEQSSLSFSQFFEGSNIADESFKKFLQTTAESGTVYNTSAEALKG